MKQEDDLPIGPALYEAMRKLGADSALLSIVGSWRDTMPDEWVLESLERWNARRLPFRERVRFAWRVLRQKPNSQV